MKVNLKSYLLLTALFLTTLPSMAQAQHYFTFVGGQYGVDNYNDCSSPRDASCRSFNFADTQVADGGSITCMDADWYGAAIITNSVTIDCANGGGVFDSFYITINAPGKTVRLRNMSITNTFFPSVPAIEIIAAASVELENVYVTNGNKGIYDHRTGPGRLSVRDSVVVGSAGPGIVIVPQGGSIINIVLENVSARDNTYGLAIATGARVMATHSVFSQNSVAGIESDPGGIVEVNDTLISNNATGLIASGGFSISISNANIWSNNTGISGPTQSFGNNRIVRNAVSDGTPPTPFGAASSEYGLR